MRPLHGVGRGPGRGSSRVGPGRRVTKPRGRSLGGRHGRTKCISKMKTYCLAKCFHGRQKCPTRQLSLRLLAATENVRLNNMKCVCKTWPFYWSSSEEQ